MKKPGLAFVFNFLLAGAGLAYLGMWVWGVVNLVVTLVIAYMVIQYAPEQIGLAGTVVPIVNGVLALSIARAKNAS